MKRFITILILFISVNTIAQELSVTAGGEDAYCRLYGYQNGNGIVYAFASGGTPDYSYEWINLTTGATYTSTTWGGLNVGCYEITVTDMVGTIAKDTVCLDSINPVAEFLVVSPELDSVGWAYLGEAPASVSFQTVGIPMASPPFFDTSFIFRPQGFEPWVAYEDEVGEFTTYEYLYGGVYTATMIAINKNGCTDTAHAAISLTGPLDIQDNDYNMIFNIISNSETITINIQDFENELLLNLYSLTGQHIQSNRLMEMNNKLNAPADSGIYLYEIINPQNGQKIEAGKIKI